MLVPLRFYVFSAVNAAYVEGFINLKPDAPSVFVLKKISKTQRKNNRAQTTSVLGQPTSLVP